MSHARGHCDGALVGPLQGEEEQPLQDFVGRLIARFDVEGGEAGMVQAVATDEIDYKKHQE